MNAITLTKKLIQFNTSNPPGNEKECILWIKTLFDQAGIQSSILSKGDDRLNIVARIEGRKQAPPLLLYGHVDVVTTQGQNWKYPPFDGVSAEGCVWGRGALDMKGGLAMMLAALLRLCKEGKKPAGDIVFAAVSDEEAGGDFGAKYLVEEHPDFFEGVRYAIGEFGGFPVYIGNQCFYFIQTGEKQRCWMKATIKGSGGHGSQRHTGGTMATLGRILTIFDKKRLPVHITPIVRDMVHTMADNLPLPSGFMLKKLLNPLFTDTLIGLMGEKGEMFDPLLHNTVNITMVDGGNKINVIPSEISFFMDGRILPGYGADDLISEIKGLAGNHFSIEVLRHEPCPPEPDMGMFDRLATTLKKKHPGAVVVPLLLPGFTDAGFFSRLGIQTYGFLPMNLPRDLSFNKLIHAADERVPEQCLEFGTSVIYDVIQQGANGSLPESGRF